MEQPEVKAQVDEAREEAKGASRASRPRVAIVCKAMDRRQAATFKKMLGKPFDVGIRNWVGEASSAVVRVVREDGGTGPMATPTRPRPRPKLIPPRQRAADADSSAAATPRPRIEPRTPRRRQSLRERRGLGGQQSTPDGESPN